jgi:3-oxoadipate CoA-transferase beta subunit
VPELSYPVTGIECVKRIYTDLATFSCSAEGLEVIDMVPGLSLRKLEYIANVPLKMAQD